MKDISPLILPQSPTALLHCLYHLLKQLLGSSFLSVLCCIVMAAFMSWVHSKHSSFMCSSMLRKPEVTQYWTWWTGWMRTQQHVFPSHWMALVSSILHILSHFIRQTVEWHGNFTTGPGTGTHWPLDISLRCTGVDEVTFVLHICPISDPNLRDPLGLAATKGHASVKKQHSVRSWTCRVTLLSYTGMSSFQSPRNAQNWDTALTHFFTLFKQWCNLGCYNRGGICKRLSYFELFYPEVCPLCVSGEINSEHNGTSQKSLLGRLRQDDCLRSPWIRFCCSIIKRNPL